MIGGYKAPPLVTHHGRSMRVLGNIRAKWARKRRVHERVGLIEWREDQSWQLWPCSPDAYLPHHYGLDTCHLSRPGSGPG